MGLFDWFKHIMGIPDYDRINSKLNYRIQELLRLKRNSDAALNKPKKNTDISFFEFDISASKEETYQSVFHPHKFEPVVTMSYLQQKREEELQRRIAKLHNSFVYYYDSAKDAISKENITETNKCIDKLTAIVAELKDQHLADNLQEIHLDLNNLKDILFERERERIRREEERRLAEENARKEAERRRRELEQIERERKEQEAREYEERLRREEKRINQERIRLKGVVTGKSDDADRIIEYLREKGVCYFYHFTARENLKSIKKYGGLLSWKYCEDNDINIPSAGGSNKSRQLDERHGLEDYVRLSFCSDHPMAYRLQQDGKRLVLLKIKIEVATFKHTQFSNMNAADNCVSHGVGFKHLRNVNIRATQRSYVSRQDEDFSAHQAECMIKTFLPIEYIVNFNNPIPLS